MDYSSIQDFYTDAENHGGSWPDTTNIDKRLVKFSENIEDQVLKNLINCERAIYNYGIKAGKLIPLMSSTTEDGEIFSYPNFDLIDEDGYKHLISRAECVKNLNLIIRYNHILWHSPKKNRQFAQRALNAYFTLFHENIDKDNIHTFDKVNLLKNALTLAFESKIDVEKFKKLVNDVLFKEGFWKYEWKVNIIEFMLNSVGFKREDFNGTLQLIDTINKELKQENDFHSVQRNLEVAIRVANKVKESPNEFVRQLGECCEAIAEGREDDTGTIKVLFLSEALEHFESIKDSEATERVSVKLTESKKKVKLAKISLPLDDAEPFIGAYRKMANQMLEEEPLALFNFLSNNNVVMFPDLEKLKNSKGDATFLQDLFRGIGFDINSNISQAKDDPKEKERKRIRQTYSMHLSFISSLFLAELFDKGQRREIITHESLVAYLRDYTWFGATLDQNRNGETISFKWIDMIAPALHEFFVQLELYRYTHKQNLILVIDSLTIKFEGILRDFARILKIQTLTTKNKQVREMYLEDFLNHSKMQEFFDENDRMFFNYLFLNNGMNLRNNIAHNFYRPQDYTFKVAFLLIIAIMRLSKYKVTLAVQA